MRAAQTSPPTRPRSAIKSGNVCMLRSGKEAFRTAKAIVAALKHGHRVCGGLIRTSCNIVEDTSPPERHGDHAGQRALSTCSSRAAAPGSSAPCVENATVPCIETGTGICHVYVDEVRRPGQGRAHHRKRQDQPPLGLQRRGGLPCASGGRGQIPAHAPKARWSMTARRQGLTPVELRLDAAAAHDHRRHTRRPTRILTRNFWTIFSPSAWSTVVDAAIAHMLAHSTHHSDAIVTEDAASAERFINGTDSAATYVNVSTRFTDGGEFGLGCEMGISTQKLHARGPMGLDELSTYKYIIRGDGQIR